MSESNFAAQLAASVEPLVKTDGDGNRSVSLTTFINSAIDWLKLLARAQVDTEEERDAIVAAVMKVADTLVATRLSPFVWGITRPHIQSAFDTYIDHLPELLG